MKQLMTGLLIAVLVVMSSVMAFAGDAEGAAELQQIPADVLPGEAEETEPERPQIPEVAVTVDGVVQEAVAFTDGTAQVVVNGGDKTIRTVKIDGEMVQDHSRVEGKGEDLPKSYAVQFDDEKSHQVEVTLGYKLTVETRYVNSDEKNGHYLPEEKGGTPDASAPTYYTLVVRPGAYENSNAVPLLPLASADGKYPLRLLDYSSVRAGGVDVYPVYAVPFALGSDHGTDWLQITGNQGMNPRYYTLKKMPQHDAVFQLCYNYNKIAIYVGVRFEQADGSWVSEVYDNKNLPETLKTYHLQDTLVNERDLVAFDPTEEVFKDKVQFPAGTSKEDYQLRQVYLTCDSNYGGYIYFKNWSESSNAQGASNVKTATGLSFDQNTGAVSGVLNNRVENRNHLFTYYFERLRPVQYHANGGRGAMEIETYAQDETVAVKENGFSRSGYRFTGWNTEADGSGTGYQPGDTFTRGTAEQTILYAQWRRVMLPEITEPEEPNPPIDIEDPDVPLAPGPGEEEANPPIDIEEPDVPLAPGPEDVTLDAPDVPLGDAPDAKRNKPNAPKTGDSAPFAVLVGLLVLSAGTLGAVCMRKKIFAKNQ